MELNILTVTQLTQYIKDTLESMVGRVRVMGEISGFKAASSGHAYFTLKDEGAALNCVMFRSVYSRIGFAIKDGMQVEVNGSVTVYPSRGQYQLIVESCIEAGIGLLFRKFEELKKRLEKEGLFDPARKKPLPYLPRRIGIITSPTGAAIRDMINVLTRRFPYLEILLYPTLVQGKGAAEQIAHGIRRMNELKTAEVLIVGRGGGSIEDLWAFNEEIVARAIFDSSIPIVSAVGHETDFTIADFVADLRAPTPSAAAEIVTQNHHRLIEDMEGLRLRLKNAIIHWIEVKRLNIRQLATSHILHTPLERLRNFQQTLDEISERMVLHCRILIQETQRRMEIVRAKLNALNPEAVLERGYSIVMKPPGMEIVRKADEAKEGETLEVRLFKGRLEVNVTGSFPLPGERRQEGEPNNGR
jgi:exodeoxyribonuclease VII large subunit